MVNRTSGYNMFGPPFISTNTGSSRSSSEGQLKIFRPKNKRKSFHKNLESRAVGGPSPGTTSSLHGDGSASQAPYCAYSSHSTGSVT
ncbi:hypothetical protein E4U55_000879 [Claviceps digitariae]|nr:hypothetical protein E4U55_000879 [Claviceps digitariae]